MVIHHETIQRLFILQHGIGIGYHFDGLSHFFENNGLYDLKKRFCDLYSWVIKSNYLHGSDTYDLPEKTETILEFVQEQENIMRCLSVPESISYKNFEGIKDYLQNGKEC